MRENFNPRNLPTVRYLGIVLRVSQECCHRLVMLHYYIDSAYCGNVYIGAIQTLVERVKTRTEAAREGECSYCVGI